VITHRSEGGGISGLAAYAVDPDNVQRLWETSERLLA
jgi:hypothetical protein